MSQILAPALLFGSVPLTLMFSSLMVSTATIILGGIPAAIYERFAGVKDDSTVISLWIWLAGTAILTIPAIGNFIKSGFSPAHSRDQAERLPPEPISRFPDRFAGISLTSARFRLRRQPARICLFILSNMTEFAGNGGSGGDEKGGSVATGGDAWTVLPSSRFR